MHVAFWGHLCSQCPTNCGSSIYSEHVGSFALSSSVGSERKRARRKVSIFSRGLSGLPAPRPLPRRHFHCDGTSVVEFHGIVNANIASVQVLGGSIQNFWLSSCREYFLKSIMQKTQMPQQTSQNKSHACLRYFAPAFFTKKRNPAKENTSGAT